VAPALALEDERDRRLRGRRAGERDDERDGYRKETTHDRFSETPIGPEST
jgi:hypothetical protein